MHKGKILQQFLHKFTIYKDLNGKLLMDEWVARVVFLIQSLLIFSSRCISYFTGYPMLLLFQLVLTNFSKVICFCVH